MKFSWKKDSFQKGRTREQKTIQKIHSSGIKRQRTVRARYRAVKIPQNMIRQEPGIHNTGSHSPQDKPQQQDRQSGLNP